MRDGNKDGEIQFRPKGGKGSKRMNEIWRSPEEGCLWLPGTGIIKEKALFRAGIGRKSDLLCDSGSEEENSSG